MEKLKNIKDFFYFIVLIFTTFLIIYHSPAFFPRFLPDSYDYITFENATTRNLFYTAMYLLFKNLNIEIFYIQIFILSLSICFLLFVLNLYKINKYLIFFFWVLVTVNIYYTSFSKTIIPEVIFFSLVNFSLGLLILNIISKSLIYFFFFSLSLGLLAITKKVGVILSISFMVFYIIKYGTRKKNIFLILFVSFIFICENLFYFNFHKSRASVLPTATVGKLFYIAGTDSFNFDKYKTIKNFRTEFIIISDKSKVINEFISSIKNPFMRAEIKSDYEVVLQYQNIFNLENYDDFIKSLKKNYKKIFFEIVKNNPFEYIKISSAHYMGMWVAGTKYTGSFNDKEKFPSIPNKEYLEKSSSEIKLPNLFLLKMANLSFIILFILFFSTSFIYIGLIFKRRKIETINFLYLISNIYLCLVSLINVSTIRYLMPIYPIIILGFIIVINKKVFKK